MGRCGCANEICACTLIGGDGIVVSGNGSEENPYVVESTNAGLNLLVQDTDTVDLTLTGVGTPTNPFILSADSTLDFTNPDTLEWRALANPATETNLGVAATPTLVPFTVDNGGNGINQASGRLVVTKAGVYHVVAALTYRQLTATSTWSIQQLIQRRAGAAIATRETVAQPNASGGYDMGTLVGDFVAEPNDTFEVIAWSSAANLLAVAASRAHFVAHRLAGPGQDGLPGADGAPGPPGPTGSANVPIGTVMAWAGPNPPNNYMFCNGASLSTASYPDLFNVIGYRYGGSGANFNLPLINNRFVVAVGSTYTLGQTGGNTQHSHTIPGHTHGNTGQNNINEQLNAGHGNGLVMADSGHVHATGGATPALSAQAAANNSLPPFIALNYIIRVVPTGAVDNMTARFFKGSAAANTAVAYGANVNMPFTVRNDIANAWSTANNNWVVPAPGRYRISVAYKATAGAVRQMRIMRNGAAVSISPDGVVALAGGFFMDVLDLAAGDTIAVQPTAAFTTSSDGAGVTNTYLIIESVGLQAAP